MMQEPMLNATIHTNALAAATPNAVTELLEPLGGPLGAIWTLGISHGTQF